MEQRCKNRFSPRVASSLSLGAPGATAEGLFWALNSAKQPTEMQEKARAKTVFDLIFKMSFRLPSKHRNSRWMQTECHFCTAARLYCQEIRYAIRQNNYAL